ncbi:hypothetical protein ASZ90_002107 [hydrocarbon metagenome]|uniref:Uncharacterized protein n=1 Tax=hydrocarbon metagenome TaxID=938273 RepID=A0A0W8G4J7_9ZZZZ
MHEAVSRGQLKWKGESKQAGLKKRNQPLSITRVFTARAIPAARPRK